MKLQVTIFLFLGMMTSCSTNKNESNSSPYLKVIINGDALKPNAYNKGIGAHYFLFFNLRTDSVVYLYPEFKESDENKFYVNHAFKGSLDNSNYRDNLMQVIHSLDWRPVGIIDSIPDDAMYCGWEYYVEFRIGKQVKYYSVIAGVNDTLDGFFDFFQSLENYPWTKSSADPKIINIDNEVVDEMKRFGTYEKRDVPYLFPACDTVIDFSRLVGRWRTVGRDYHSTRKDRFYSHTFNQDKTFLIQKYTEGKFEDLVKGTYSVDLKGRKIFFTRKDGQKMTLTLTQLTDSCFSGLRTSQEGKNSTIKLNRY